MSDALRAAAEQLIDPQGRELAKAVRWLELDLPGLDPALRWPVAVVGDGHGGKGSSEDEVLKGEGTFFVATH